MDGDSKGNKAKIMSELDNDGATIKERMRDDRWNRMV
jgi:hypothetical protein